MALRLRTLRAPWALLPLLLVGCGDDPATDRPSDPSEDAADDTDTIAEDAVEDAQVDPIDAVADVPDDAVPDDAAPDVPPIPSDTIDAAELDVPDDAPDADPGPDPVLLTLDEALAAIDPFTGTGGTGFAYAALTPAVQRPVGFVRFGPDTTTAGFHPGVTHFSGYNFDTPHVRGFSHTHFVGTGAPDYGNLRLFPVRSWDTDAPETTWTARDSEQASPGYYEVRLPDEALQVRISAGRFSGVLETVVEGDDPVAILFDAAASVTDTGVRATRVEFDGDTIEAIVDYRGPFVGRTRAFDYHFVATFDPPPDRWDAWGEPDGDGVVTGERSGAIAIWDTPPARIVVRTGLSMDSLENARTNRAAEIGDRGVDEVAEEARAEWAELIGKVRIAALDAEQADQFYSALYNAYRMPSQWSEAGGRYFGFDGAVHVAEDFTYYTDLSIWDTFRTLHPWYELTNPTLTRDVSLSLLDMAVKGDGRVPRWPAAASYTGSMIGSCGEIVLGGAAAKEIEGVDWEAAFDVSFASSFRPLDEPEVRGRDGVARYVELGFLPHDEFNESVSKTIEYAWTDEVLRRWALRHGRDDQAEFLAPLAVSFENVFDPATRFFAPRLADGTFEGAGRERNIFMRSGPFTEGNAWHWRFYGLLRVDRLSSLFGGDDALAEAIEEFFTRSNLRRPGPIREVLPPTFYWHGNEPSIHNAPMLAMIGHRDRAIHWSREIAYRLYGTGPDGLPGNDDGGTMSAWWLFTALGLYPLAGTDEYIWTYPLVPEAEVDTSPSTRLRIEAPGARRAPPAGTVRLWIDGVEHTDPLVRHAQIVDATLRFEVDAP